MTRPGTGWIRTRRRACIKYDWPAVPGSQVRASSGGDGVQIRIFTSPLTSFSVLSLPLPPLKDALGILCSSRVTFCCQKLLQCCPKPQVLVRFKDISKQQSRGWGPGWAVGGVRHAFLPFSSLTSWSGEERRVALVWSTPFPSWVKCGGCWECRWRTRRPRQGWGAEGSPGRRAVAAPVPSAYLVAPTEGTCVVV